MLITTRKPRAASTKPLGDCPLRRLQRRFFTSSLNELPLTTLRICPLAVKSLRRSFFQGYANRDSGNRGFPPHRLAVHWLTFPTRSKQPYSFCAGNASTATT